LNSPQYDSCILIREYEKKILLYIFCNMGFKDKAHELNLLVVPWLQIKLQLNYNYNMFKHSKQTKSKGMVPLFLMFKKT